MQNGLKKKKKSVGENALLMRQIRREWPDWFVLKATVTQITAVYKKSISEYFSWWGWGVYNNSRRSLKLVS